MMNAIPFDGTAAIKIRNLTRQRSRREEYRADLLLLMVGELFTQGVSATMDLTGIWSESGCKVVRSISEIEERPEAA